MNRNQAFGITVAVLVATALALSAFRLGRKWNGQAPEAAPSKEDRRVALEAIERRLQRLEGKLAASGALPAGAAEAEVTEVTEVTAQDDDRLAAVESALAAVELRLSGLEKDPLHRGESFLHSENATLRREGINTLRRVARFDPPTREAIRGLLHDPSSQVREQAAQVLGDLKDKESAPVMKTLLADTDPATRRRAVEALGSFDARDAAPEIGQVLVSDADERVRIAAADVLGTLKASEAEEFLAAALKDRSESVRGEAIASLGEIGAAASAPRLRAMYDQDPGRNRIRLALALKSLGDDGPQKMEVARLSDLLRTETDERIRRDAQRELASLTRNP